MRRLIRGLKAFFESLAAVTLMTALGLIGAIIFTSSSLGAIVWCASIAALGFAIIGHQMYRACARLAEEEEDLEYARPRFDSLSESHKESIECIAIQKSVDVGSIPDHGQLEKTGFVLRDPVLGRLVLNPEHRQIIRRLVKEWRAKK